MAVVEASIVAGTSPTPLTASVRGRILLYCSVLLFLPVFGAPYAGFILTPVQFFLKNKLHLSASQLAVFGILAAIPLYLSVIFGFTRDRWNPFGRGDRGFLMIFGLTTALIYVALAYSPVTYYTVLGGVMIATSSYLMVSSAIKGMLSTFGQQHVMSGAISTVWNVVETLPVLIAFALGGRLSEHLEAAPGTQGLRTLFLIAAAIMTGVAAYGLWKPKGVFDHLKNERDGSTSPWSDMKRLVRHWPIYPALFIWFLWDFSPGSGTVLQYYLSNTLHAKDSVWGDYNAIFAGAFVPTFLLYGVLCRKYSLRTLLIWGTVIAVPQMIPLMFIPTAQAALYAAVPIGLMGGICTAAYIDLIIRSCPKGLQGSMWMLAGAAYWVATTFGNLLGAKIYEHFEVTHNGFAVCAWLTTAVYALILPVIWLVPRNIMSTREGEVATA